MTGHTLINGLVSVNTVMPVEVLSWVNDFHLLAGCSELGYGESDSTPGHMLSCAACDRRTVPHSLLAQGALCTAVVSELHWHAQSHEMQYWMCNRLCGKWHPRDNVRQHDMDKRD